MVEQALDAGPKRFGMGVQFCADLARNFAVKGGAFLFEML